MIKTRLQETHDILIRGDQTGVLTQENIADDAMASVTGAMCLHSVNNVQRYFPAAIRMENL